ncbi:MAG: rcc01693 family protein [Tropicimonas sp.]|uniref:rcc01693 family protein n=1 Tax=Tropicimonas sp. TaxID=2067044 RepID=UPI003A8A7B49
MDWAGLLRLGLRELRLAPAAFWRLTPAELVLMLGLEAGRPALTRARLDELARAYPDSRPDSRKENGNGH